jgi:cytochrome c-type biogenesis protein CcmH
MLALVLLFMSGACLAKPAVPAAGDPALEKRVVAIAENLRCLVCQNQSIADSNAELARDLRKQVREQLKAGASDQAVIDHMVARYGQFILYRPPLRPATLLLWFGPFLLLAGGLVFLGLQVRQRRALLRNRARLTEAERARAREILGGRAERA